MAFVSFGFLLFTAATAMVYFLAPERSRWVVLLAAGLLFLFLNSGWLTLIVLGTSAVTWLFGLWLHDNDRKTKETAAALTGEARRAARETGKKRGKRILSLGIILVLGTLLLLKYYDFFARGANGLLGRAGFALPRFRFLLPLGISFYTLQAIAYMTDIQRGKLAPDRDPAKFLLFMTYFPQIVQGPIPRHHQLAGQLYAGHAFDARRVFMGAQLILWGFMKKLILADRVSVPVVWLFSHYAETRGLCTFLAGVLYGVQVYADFSGGMDITRGVSEIFGIELEQNFRQPYFARSVEEFWRRWHITLGAWMRDYVFYPLSLSRGLTALGKKARGRLGPQVGKRVPAFISMFIVYFLVGFWHGAEWKYIGYGVWNGLIIMTSLLLPEVYARARGALSIREESRLWRGFQMLRTFILCSLGRYFSRAESLGAALAMFRLTASRWYDLSFLFDGTLTGAGLNAANWAAALVMAGLVFWVDCLHERDVHIRESITARGGVFRWCVYCAAVMAVIVFGMYGPGYDAGSFIYEQF